MAESCASSCDTNSVALRKGCFTKEKNILIHSFAALRPSVGFLDRFVTV